ncbi:MAG: HD domain-containing protein [Candidatus Uhrbacteria bacterium]
MSNKKIESSVKKLAKQGKFFYVGGFVRDFLSGENPKDADVEVYDVSIEELEKILKNIFGQRKVKTIGKFFSVLHVVLDKDYSLDVSLARRDAKQGPGHRGILVQADPKLSMIEAARRRDFTINAMSLDPVTGEIFDFFGGREDLKNKILRVVEAKTFVEDPLRALRAVQFASRFSLEIEPKTFKLIKKMVRTGALEELSIERIREEFNKLLLKSEKPSVGLGLMKELGILKKFFPEFLELSSCHQEPAWHPEGDVWAHTKIAVDVAVELSRQRKFSEEERLIILLSAFCHDLGKVQTTKKIKGRIRSSGHAEIGCKLAKSFLRRFKYSGDIVKKVSTVVLEHRSPPRLLKKLTIKEIDDRRYIGEVADLLRRLGEVKLSVFLTVCEADFRGKKQAGAFEAGQKLKKTIHDYRLSNRPLLLGRDILQIWSQLQKDRPLAGRRIGEYLKKVNEHQRLGEILNKREALEFLKKIISRVK